MHVETCFPSPLFSQLQPLTANHPHTSSMHIYFLVKMANVPIGTHQLIDVPG